MERRFLIDLFRGPVLDQKRSGRCWIYASMNPIRQKTGLCFSTNYTYFYDQMEKSRVFLDKMSAMRDTPFQSQELSELLREPISSVGQWCYFASLTDRYGLVPLECMPDTKATADGTGLTRALGERLRYGAWRVRNGEDDTEQILNEIEEILRKYLGNPPEQFEWEEESYTPLSFFRERCHVDFHNYITLIHHPSERWPAPCAYHEVECPKHRDPLLTLLSVDMETMKRLTLRQLLDGEQVVIGCDVRHCGGRKEGVLDLALGDGRVRLSKADAIAYREIKACHVMSIDGWADAGLKWRVQDSHGTETGSDGHYVMTDDWFDAFVLSAVVKKEYLTSSLRNLLEHPIYMPKTERF